MGQVLKPQDSATSEALVLWLGPARSPAELANNVEDADKYRHLDQDRQASAERVHPLLLVDLRHLLPLPLRIVPELGADLVHLRFQILHRAHASDLLHRKREKQATHDHRQHNDRKPPRGAYRLMEVQQDGPEDVHYGGKKILEKVCYCIDHQIFLILPGRILPWRTDDNGTPCGRP